MNLLPPREQIQVRYEYYTRLLSTVFLGVAIVSVFGIVSLVPAYLSLFFHKENVIAETEALQKSIALEDKSVAAEFASAKKEISVLTAGKGKNSVTEDIMRVLGKKEGVGGIHITAITYEKRGTEDGISIGGEADDRASLRAFQKALEEEYRFGKVNIPVSNFVKEHNIPFTVTIALRTPDASTSATTQ